MDASRFVILVLVFSVPLLFKSGHSWAGHVKEAEKGWQKFEKEYGGKWSITWGPKTGLPRSLTGLSGTRAGPFAGEPAQAAHTFLMSHKPMFGLERKHVKLKLLSSKISYRGETDYGFKTTYRVAYVLEYKGLEVHDAQIIVIVDQDGKIGGVTSSAWEVGPLNIRPTLSISSVKTLVGKLVEPEEVEFQREPVLQVYHEASGRLIYWIEFLAGQHKRPIFCALDAHDGSVVKYIDKYKLNEQSKEDGIASGSSSATI